jgi:propionate CoA-transferase
MKIISATDAAELVQDEWCIVPGGFGSCGHPDSLTKAIRNRFITRGRPRNLKLFFGPGPGDRRGNGLDCLAIDGLVRKAIGGFWGLCPALAAMAQKGLIEAHNWPQGVISKLFSAIAAGAPGIISPVGLATFVDPRIDGGVIDSVPSLPLVERVSFREVEYLFYPSQILHCALLRGTSADIDGNICFSEETSYMDALAQAQAVKNCGGIVIVQVKRLGERRSLAPSHVRIPGLLVDYVVVAAEEDHPQTYGRHFDASFTSSEVRVNEPVCNGVPLCKLIIADRAALELGKHQNANVNLGIGIPALVGERAQEFKIPTGAYNLTVESGVIGGVPEQGLSFGAAMSPAAFIEQSAMFDFYDGGGLDIAFLGFGEVDARGNVNVSKFAGRMPGAGGFINISQSAKKVVFCGTLASGGLDVEVRDGKLVVCREGNVQKFVPRVTHLTFNAELALSRNKEVLYITERAVFALRNGQLQLIEVAPGVTVSSLQGAVGCDFIVSDSLVLMPNFALHGYAVQGEARSFTTPPAAFPFLPCTTIERAGGVKRLGTRW